MSAPEELIRRHLEYRKEAEERYRAEMAPDTQTATWAECLRCARDEVEELLAATENLNQVPSALLESGSYARPLRFMTGPPLSQDQFQLACPEWPKGSEKSARPLDESAAERFGEVFRAWADPTRTESLEDPKVRERAVHSTAILIASQEFATRKRMRLAAAQEESAARVLSESGFRKVAVGFVDRPGAIAALEYAQGCQFATADGSSHEVDLAVGLRGGRILALECKVSNDRTNSVKRINDVLKKAEAWRTKWGQFVVTGALLEGVFSEKEPRRLVEAEVELFWSHRLEHFAEWVARESGASA